MYGGEKMDWEGRRVCSCHRLVLVEEGVCLGSFEEGSLVLGLQQVAIHLAVVTVGRQLIPIRQQVIQVLESFLLAATSARTHPLNLVPGGWKLFREDHLQLRDVLVGVCSQRISWKAHQDRGAQQSSAQLRDLKNRFTRVAPSMGANWSQDCKTWYQGTNIQF